MTMWIAAKLVLSLVLGMTGIPVGILPSVFFFRDLANGTDASEASKRRYAWTLWGGMAVGWLLACMLVWAVLSAIWG